MTYDIPPSDRDEFPEDAGDRRFAELMRTIQDDAAMDRSQEWFETLRSRSLAQFAGEAPEQIATRSAHPRRSEMIALMIRFVTAAAVCVAVVGASFLAVTRQSNVEASVTFAEVLASLREAETWQLKVVRGTGEQFDVYVRSSGRVRSEESDGSYRIAQGTRLWRVDANDGSSVEGESPWYSAPDSPVDLLRLLEVGELDSGPLLKARPIRREALDGHDCLVFDVRLAVRHARDSSAHAGVLTAMTAVDIEAFVDAKSRRLVELRAWPPGADRAARGVPLAELRMIAVDVPVPDEKFAVNESLADDGRLGTVSDSQGLVVLRPALAKRWTPISRDAMVKAGDWLRCDRRGANAIRVTLTTAVEVTLGPGTLVEFVTAEQVRLHEGFLRVRIPESKTKPRLEVLAPRGVKHRELTKLGETLLRTDAQEQIVDVRESPQWLTGFDGTTTRESLGSLLVNLPDGRSEPLSVGFHRVSVEIRDQIARTTIEESFVNHTDSRLEGTFHFPLPQDASISGFGMWIGNELVEADIVEKQRAREIYETILREKRDPGLLEWNGGNEFKARVFPIEARSEKRIRIVYTQVLPMRANRYRYSYGLRSELLRNRPLRDLSISVTIASAIPLKSISCSSHAARKLDSPNGARVEFSAQDYTPTRDFELSCEIDGRQSDVVVVPHRRGDDGYFLLQLTPPVNASDFVREETPEGEPLSLVILCDTSASMNAEKRREQAELVAALLSSLGSDDRFQLGAVDVETTWASDKPLTPGATANDKAIGFLHERVSLGWTDLERAVREALRKSSPGTQVIYVGDGLATAGIAPEDTDGSALVKRIERLMEQPLAGDKASMARKLHTVTVGNVNDLAVMRGMASVGGGSSRTISGEQTGSVVARELLNELARPGLSDLQVEFRGLKVAAVYPEKIPNLPEGTQQILVGRYLPTGKDQRGEVVVTGKRGIEPVRYAARVELANAEEGNSFVPRLWARSHLDRLLDQGTNDSIRDQILGLSEEFHIITPYTSLLVLETDADRERFGVKRRFEMRDGERFFAEGKAKINFELVEAQAKRSAEWRLELRRSALRMLSRMGRDPQVIARLAQVTGNREAMRSDLDSDSVKAFDGASLYRLDLFGVQALPKGRATGGMGLGMGELSGFGGGSSLPSLGGEIDALGRLSNEEAAFFGDYAEGFEDLRKSDDGSLDNYLAQHADASDFEWRYRGLNNSRSYFMVEGRKSFVGAKEKSFDTWEDRDAWDSSSLSLVVMHDSAQPSPEHMTYLGREGIEGLAGIFGRGRKANRGNHYAWSESLPSTNSPFPLPGRPTNLARRVDVPAGWSPEAVQRANQLLRREAFGKNPGGWKVRRDSVFYLPAWKIEVARRTHTVLASSSAWLTRTDDREAETLVNYCVDGERGCFSRMTKLGTSRSASSQEEREMPLGFEDGSLVPLYAHRQQTKASVEPLGEGEVKIVVRSQEDEVIEEITMDTSRSVVRRIQSFDQGRPSGARLYDDFVEIDGLWFAKSVSHRDSQDREEGKVLVEVQSLDAVMFEQRMRTELAERADVLFSRIPIVDSDIARQNAVDGKAGVDDYLSLIDADASRQQWDSMMRWLDALERVAVSPAGMSKDGLRWLRLRAYRAAGRKEETRQGLLTLARQLADAVKQGRTTIDALALSAHLWSEVRAVGSTDESLELLNILEPVHQRQDDQGKSLRNWDERVATEEEREGRYERSLARRERIAVAAPWDANAQVAYARTLRKVGRGSEALDWIRREWNREAERNRYDWEVLTNWMCEHLRTESRWEELIEFTRAWGERLTVYPEYHGPFEHHLEALVFADKFDDANRLAEGWLQDARIPGRLSPVVAARLQAALQLVEGRLPHLRFRQKDWRWGEPLAASARFYLEREEHGAWFTQTFVHSQLNDSDLGDELRGAWLTRLSSECESLAPFLVERFVSQTIHGRVSLAKPLQGRFQLRGAEVPDEVWRPIAVTLRRRWREADNEQSKQLLAESLRAIHGNRLGREEYLGFLRERVAASQGDDRKRFRRDLFNALLQENWTDERELEVLRLFREIIVERGDQPAIALVLRELVDLVDKLVNARLLAVDVRVFGQGRVDKLTRTELQTNFQERVKAERVALSDRLLELIRQEEAMLARLPANEKEDERETSTAIVTGLRLEQMWFDVSLQRNLAECEKHAWQLLGETPRMFVAPVTPVTPDVKKGEIPPATGNGIRDLGDASADEADKLWKQFTRTTFESLARHRALAIVMQLALRKSAPAASIERVLTFLEAGEKLDAKSRDSWRQTRFLLLVALDRADTVEQVVRGWIREDKSLSPWRMALAKLIAERGNLPEAVTIFESCRNDNILTGDDLTLLSQWQNALGRRADFERSRWEGALMTPENQLHRRLQQYQRFSSRQTGPTSTLDESVVLSLRALFTKSASPSDYLDLLGGLYRETHESPLLQTLPHAFLGHSPQSVYAALNRARSAVLESVREEAGTDEILERIRVLRKEPLSPLDMRALDLLESMVESRAAEVVNQPGGHREAAITALRRAFEREWSHGEPLLMATFLRQLGKLPDPMLADEQLRQLRALIASAPEASRDRLQMTEDLCVSLFWSYGRQSEALPIMEQAISSYESIHNGSWPYEDNGRIDAYVSMLAKASRHADAERLLLRRIDKASTIQQSQYFDKRLSNLYLHAFEHSSSASLKLATGREKLFAALIERWRVKTEAAASDQSRLDEVRLWVKTLEVAVNQRVPNAKTEVERLAFEELPRLLRRQVDNSVELSLAPIAVIEAALGNREMMRYRVERLERYPRRLETEWNSYWQNLGDSLEGLRTNEKGDLLEHRAFLLIEERLKLALQMESYLNDIRGYTHVGYNTFWVSRADEFAEAAEAVLRQSPRSGRIAMSVANYLYLGLRRESRGIEVLAAAAKAGILDDAGIALLASRLSQSKRSGEAISWLELLVERHPKDLSYRSSLLDAYHAAKRPQQYRKLFDETMEQWRREGRWTEGVVAEMGQVALRSKDYRQCIELLNEAIASRRRTVANNGRGDSALSNYYQYLSSAYSAEGDTIKAVEAASGAIVCWTSSQRQQLGTIQNLEQVLEQAKDLDSFAKHLDSEAERTGQDSPLVRRALGTAYQNRRLFPQALRQFRIAVDLQPADRRLHETLFNGLVAAGEQEAATDHLLRRVEFNPGDLDWMKKIAVRLRDDSRRAERAITTIVELAPQEASHHAAVAEIRQSQNRWEEALGHWRRVATLKRLDPSGLIHVAAAEIELKRWDDARRTMKELERSPWLPRFEESLQFELGKLKGKLPE
jgi:hypothetical protein